MAWIACKLASRDFKRACKSGTGAELLGSPLRHHHSPRHRSIVEALEDTTTDDFGGVVSSPRSAAAARRQTAYRLPRVFTRGVDAEWEETFTKIWNL